MTLVKDRMHGSDYSAAELFYNARWRELVIARCALEGATCGDRDPAVVEGSAFVAKLRLRVADAEWKYADAVRDVETRLWRPMTDDERMVGFGKPHPDGAMAEARPWDANYLPPGMTWTPKPVTAREMAAIAKEAVAESSVVPPQEPVPTPAPSVEERLAGLREAYRQTQVAIAAATTDAEREALRGALATLAADAAALKGGGGA